MRVSVWFMSTLCVLFCNLYAEAITEESVGYFQVSTLLATTVKVAPVTPTPPIVPAIPTTTGGAKVMPPPLTPPTPPIVPPGTPKVTPTTTGGANVMPPPLTPPTPPIVPPGTPKVTPTTTGGAKVTPPPSSIPLTLETDGIWRDTADSVFAQQISDHALAGEMVDGYIPVYTWNTWGFQARGGFSANTESVLATYTAGRLKEQIGILFQIFNKSPEAIICLQEVNEQTAKARTAMLNGLKALNVEAEFVKNTGTQSFGQVILYRTDRYKPVRAFKSSTPDGYSLGAAGRFDSKVDPQQNGRVLKVYFEELTGKKRQLAVVNVHLAFNSLNISGLLNELVTYSQGSSPSKPLAVITGDFNYTVGKYVPTDPKVTVKQVGKSVIWSPSANVSSTKQTANNVDGFIIVQP